MFEHVESFLRTWSDRTSERQKLQHFYVMLLVSVVFVAGIGSLINAHIARPLTDAAYILIVAFVVNLIAWGVLRSTLLDKLNEPPTPARRGTRR